MRNEESLKRLRQLTKQEDNGIRLGRYGLGKERTHEEFEEYAGINYSEKLLHPDTTAGKPPPSGPVDTSIVKLNQEILLVWDVAFLKNQTQANEFDFIYIGLENEKGEVLLRVDIKEKNYPTIFSMDQSGIRLKFEHNERPHKWILWPHSKKNGWLKRHDEIISNGQQKIVEVKNSLELTAKEKRAVKKGLQAASEI